MEISSIGEILRRNANRQKYNSGFLFYKNKRCYKWQKKIQRKIVIKNHI